MGQVSAPEKNENARDSTVVSQVLCQRCRLWRQGVDGLKFVHNDETTLGVSW